MFRSKMYILHGQLSLLYMWMVLSFLRITELIVLFKFCFLKSFYVSYKEATLKVLNLNTMYIYFYQHRASE